MVDNVRTIALHLAPVTTSNKLLSVRSCWKWSFTEHDNLQVICFIKIKSGLCTYKTKDRVTRTPLKTGNITDFKIDFQSNRSKLYILTLYLPICL
jgi:hypothetical protein